MSVTIIATPTHPDANSYLTVAEADAMITNRPNTQNWGDLTADQKAYALVMASEQIDALRFFDEKYYNQSREYRRKQSLSFPQRSSQSAKVKVNSVEANAVVCGQLANRTNMPDDHWNGGALVVSDGTGKGQTYQISDFDMATGKVTISENFATQPDSLTSYVTVIMPVPDKVKRAVVEQALFISSGGGERSQLQAEGVKSYSIGDLSETYGDGASSGGEMPISVQAKAHLKGLISRIGRISR
jgi:hypothetical protein